MPIDADDLARTALLELIPRGPYRLAAPSDERFAAFAPGCVRVAFRQAGPTPSLLLFCRPGEDPGPLAAAAAGWAAGAWRPNAVDRTVKPQVVAVQVGAGPELVEAGPVADAAVPAIVWTVDALTGVVRTPSPPPGGPPPGPVRKAAAALAAGGVGAPIGALSLAEQRVMHGRPVSYPIGAGAIIAAAALILLALRFGIPALRSLASAARGVAAGSGVLGGLASLAMVGIGAAALIGWIVLALLLTLDAGGVRSRWPGFSSRRRAMRALTWAGFIAILVVGAGLVAGGFQVTGARFG